MSHYIFDRRDIDFVLYEQLDLEALTALPRYTEFSREVFDMVLTEAGKFAREVLSPLNQPSDRQGCRLEDGRVKTPAGFKEAFRRCADNGWIGAPHAPEHGGQGLPFVLNLAVTELFIGACTSFFFYQGLTSAAGHLVETFASPELAERFVPRMYSGQWTGTMCLTEPQAGSAVGDLKTSATPNDDGTYSITGTKIFISGGDQDLSENILHLVLARVEGDPAGTRGISLFLVPRVWVNDDGSLGEDNDVHVAGLEHKMGINGCSTCVMSFGDRGACRGHLIGAPRQGIVAMFQMMNEARIICGLQGVAAANAAYQSARAYARERVQGTRVEDHRDPDAPRVSITAHADVRRMLTTMKAYAEGTRALVYKAGLYHDLAHFGADEATRERAQMMLDLVTPICKAYATDKGFDVTALAIQTYGGYGYIREYPVEQYLRDVKIASIYEGTNGIQAMDLLGRKLAMRGGALFLTYLQSLNDFIDAHREHEALAGAVAALDEAKNALAEVTFHLGQVGRRDPAYPMLHAASVLEVFGDVMVAELLIEQAARASERRPQVADDSDDARFYDDKVRTARFFCANILPRVRANAAAIHSADRSALEMSAF